MMSPKPAPQPVARECWICGDSESEVRLRRFAVLDRWVEDLICRRCLELPGEDADPWEGVTPPATTTPSA